jgi:hypothetical protein
VARWFIPSLFQRKGKFYIKLYKLFDPLTYDIKLYLGKHHEDASGNVTATHGTVQQLVRRVDNEGSKLYMHNYHLHNFFTASVTEY